MPFEESHEIEKSPRSLEEAIAAAKEYIADYFHDEILEARCALDSEKSFYVIEDLEFENVWHVHLVSNSFGDLSDFYVEISG